MTTGINLHTTPDRAGAEGRVVVARPVIEREPTSETDSPLSPRELELMHAYWRACNYLAVGMIYLKDNPLLTRPLTTDDVKHRLLGHWGASPALSFVWAHLNRVIKRDDPVSYTHLTLPTILRV